MTTQLDTLLAALVQAVLKTERSYTNLRDQRQREKCEAAETAALEAVRAHVAELETRLAEANLELAAMDKRKANK